MICIINDEMPAKSLKLITKILDDRKIDCRILNYLDGITEHSYDICFTASNEIAEELINYKNISKVFLINQKEDIENLPDAYIFKIGEDQFLDGMIDFFQANIELNKKNNIYTNTFANYVSLVVNVKKELSKTVKVLRDSRNVFDGTHGSVVVLLEIYNIFLEIESKLHGVFSCNDFIINLNSELKRNNFNERVELVDYRDVTALECKDLFPLFSSHKFILIKSILSHNFLNTGFVKYLLIKMVGEYVRKQEIKDLSSYSNEVIEKALSVLPYPFVMLRGNGELILHNQHFVGLNILPNICFNLKNEEKYECDGIPYKIHRQEFTDNNEKFIYLIFITDKEMVNITEKNLSSSELGIISSSLAHELNNPLAGILAALELLLLEDDLDEEMFQSIMAMKDSAKRSKELVEIFLGFSRKLPRMVQQGSIKTAFTQALGLLRFRMIESNIRLEIDIRGSAGNYYSDLNVSVVAMIFYMILSEIITSVSKLGLITSSSVSQSEKLVRGHLNISKDNLEISLDTSLGDLKVLSKMKLLNYLIDLEHMTLTIDQQSIYLKYVQRKN